MMLSEKPKVLYSVHCVQTQNEEWQKILDKLVCEIFMCTLVAQTGGNVFCIESAWDKKKKEHNVNGIF